MSPTDYKSKTALVIDNGLFFHFADVLSRGFKRVLYWTPWQKAFPKNNDKLPGFGFSNVERIDERFEYYNEADILIYPDVGYGGEQVYWRSQGKPVWGAGYGEELELERARTKQLIKKLGLPLGPYDVLKGVDSLRDYIKKHENVWVKLSAMRGDAETFHAKTYDLVAPVLDDLRVRLGPKATSQEFIVEHQLDAEIEIGYDGFVVDGAFAKVGIMGIEVKDAGYIGVVKPYKELPECLTSVNSKLAPVFAKYQYRGAFSSEVRVTKDRTSYLIDPCCRLGSPPSEVYVELYSNWPEIVWCGAHGEVCEPKPVAKFGAELMIESSWAESHWQAVTFTGREADKKFVKWKYPCVMNGDTFIVPNDNKVSLIGAVVGIGNTVTEAINNVKRVRKEVKGYGLHSEDDSLEDAVECIKKAAKVGVTF